MTTDPTRARQFSTAEYPEINGVRFHLTMKSSTEESTRLMAADAATASCAR